MPYESFYRYLEVVFFNIGGLNMIEIKETLVIPNAETLAAMKEAENGHDAGVVRVDSLESFMASL